MNEITLDIQSTGAFITHNPHKDAMSLSAAQQEYGLTADLVTSYERGLETRIATNARERVGTFCNVNALRPA